MDDPIQIKAKLLLLSFQLLVIFTIIVASLANIMLQSKNEVLWTSLLSCSLGYILPNPKLSLKKEAIRQISA